jgi:hypothetical protein
MDFSGNHELFPFLGDNRGFQDLAVLNDGSILALYTDSQNYSDRTYHIAYGGVNNSYGERDAPVGILNVVQFA